MIQIISSKYIHNRHRLLIGIALVVVIVVIVFVSKSHVARAWYEIQFLGKCENEGDFGVKYEEGFIVVVLNGTLKETEALNLVESYGLSLQKLSKTSYNSCEAYEALVIVPKGRERLWMCVLTELESNTVIWAHPIGRLVPW
jgi:hypothetical protein